MSYNNIIGHENIKAEFESLIEKNSLTHAHLIVGEDGIGKSIIAKEAALHILGKRRDIEYADIIFWKILKNKKSIGVDQVREIIEEVNKKPYEGEKKVVIVHDADKMTIQAQNAFLKTIEEPPKGITIMLLADNLESILDTVKSRCQIHKLKKLNEDEMNAFLKRKYPHMSESEFKPINAFSDGIPGRAESFIEDNSFKEIREIILKILIDVNTNEVNKILAYEEFFLQNKDRWREMLNAFLSYIRDTMIYKETADDSLIINIDKIDNITLLSSTFSFNKLTKFVDIINDTRENLERNVNIVLAFNVMLMKIQEV